jgi:tRNA(Arg) A34 adenosine deaminase TadA
VRHDRHIKRAVEIAQTSEHEKWHLGAVIVKGSRVLSWAPNKLRNPPWINHLQSTRHAEIAALARCLLFSQGSDGLRC